MMSSGGEGISSDSPVKSIRRLLDSPGLHQGPACFDALSAKLVQDAGFDFCFTSGIFIQSIYFNFTTSTTTTILVFLVEVEV